MEKSLNELTYYFSNWDFYGPLGLYKYTNAFSWVYSKLFSLWEKFLLYPSLKDMAWNFLSSYAFPLSPLFHSHALCRAWE